MSLDSSRYSHLFETVRIHRFKNTVSELFSDVKTLNFFYSFLKKELHKHSTFQLFLLLKYKMTLNLISSMGSYRK